MADNTKKILITPDQISRCQIYKGLGLTVQDMAALCGVSKKTFERRVHDQPELADALLKGEATATAKVTQSLFNSATKKGNVTAQIFWLKCRKGWKEIDSYDGNDEKYKEPNTLSNGKDSDREKESIPN